MHGTELDLIGRRWSCRPDGAAASETELTEFADCVAAAETLLARCRQAGLTLATAESCTGGLVAAALTAVPGSSDVFERGFVTYSNAAKADMIGVPAELIAREGAVSEAVARAMADGALAASRADLAVAVTGVAGPGGGTAAKPVGLVHLAVAIRAARPARGAPAGTGQGGATTGTGPGGAPIHRSLRHRERRYGDLGRGEIRLRSVLEALDLLSSACPRLP